MLVKYSKDKKVMFTEQDHKYVDMSGKRLTSVTTLIHKYETPFDPTGQITERYAIKNNMSVAEVKEKWRLINLESTDYGSAVHAELEHFIITGEIRESPHQWIVEQFAAIPFQGKLHAEVLIHSLLHMVAGQVDVIEDLGNKTINIWDFKTNKKLEKSSQWGNKLLGHLWMMDACNFNIYTLQLSLYAYLCELKGLKINKLVILYINRETKQMEQHEVKYKRKDVKQMLDNILNEAA